MSDQATSPARLEPSPIYRGMVRGLLPYYLLFLLSQEPAYGTQLIELIGKATGGSWHPSPGSVYPLLRRFEGQGHVKGEYRRGTAAAQRVYEITPGGRTAMAGIERDLMTDLAAARDLIDRHVRWFQSAQR